MNRALLWILGVRAVACVPVESDHILAGQLARVNPVFAALDPDLPIGLSPRPGIRRVLRVQEQAQLARRHGLAIPGPLVDACFIGAGEPAADSSGRHGRDIERGERIAVEVSSGAARLTFEAEAASGGRAGESIMVKNPQNGRLFAAIVQAKGKAVVQQGKAVVQR